VATARLRRGLPPRIMQKSRMHSLSPSHRPSPARGEGVCLRAVAYLRENKKAPGAGVPDLLLVRGAGPLTCWHRSTGPRRWRKKSGPARGFGSAREALINSSPEN